MKIGIIYYGVSAIAAYLCAQTFITIWASYTNSY